MAREILCGILCEKCNDWFRSPYQKGDAESYFQISEKDLPVNCLMCGFENHFDRRRMRFMQRLEDGTIAIMDGI